MPTQPPTRDAGRAGNDPGGPPPRGRSWFLGIGINAYRSFSSLSNAVKDVQDFLALLQKNYEIDEVITLYDEEATRRNIIRKLDDLAEQVGENDKLLIYYSGHGHLNRRGRGYWIPHDAGKDYTDDYLSNSRLKEYIEDIRARHILLLSDACFSGSLFVQGATKKTEPEAEEELEKRTSRYALCSGRHDEEVYDGKPGENSPFARSILDVLSDNQRSLLRISKVAERVIDLTISQYRQLPQHGALFDVGDRGGQYVFRLKQQQPAWAADWQKIQRHPEETLREVAAKILLVDEYTEKYEAADNLQAAFELGERLEYQREFFLARNSLFRLKQFARKKTPFQAEAKQRLAELKKGYVLPEEAPEEEPPPPPKKPKQPARKTKPQAEPSPRPEPSPNSFTDPRDGQTYKTVKLNGLVWMAENLNYDVGEGCWFYDNNPKNGEQYGRLYTWEAAKQACPPGWRLPTDEEWQSLAMSHGGLWDGRDKGDPKKAFQALTEGGKSGFAAQLGGYRSSDGDFGYLGDDGSYWCATERDAGNAWRYLFRRYVGGLYRYYDDKSVGLSCRCVQGS